MKKKILFLVLFTFLKMINVNAETLNRTYYENIYFVQNGLPDYYMSDKQFHLTFDDNNAYCLDPDLKITGYDYNVMNIEDYDLDMEVKNYLNKIIYYGYDYPGHEDVRYYMATQALIWEQMRNYKIEFFTKQYGYGDIIDVTREKKEIINMVINHDKMPWFANNTYTYNHQEEIIFEDSLLSNYELLESNYGDVTIDDNKVVIDNLDYFVGTINLKFKQKNYQNKYAKIYYRTDSQTMMTGGYLDNHEFNLTINLTGGSVTINKLDNESGRNIINSNVVINMRNVNNNTFITLNNDKDLKIDIDGKLIINNVPYGIYEITEISTNDLYELNTNPITFEVNGDVSVNLYNQKKKSNLEIIKYGDVYNYENNNYYNTFMPNVHFKLYALESIVTKDLVIHYMRDELVKEGFTDEFGNILFNDLYLGKYYLKEEVPSGFIDDGTIYIIDLKECENPEITIYNKLKKGNLIINKLDSESNEKIINSEVIINLKNIDSNNYVMINGSKDLEINALGMLEINNLPYGNYEITEISTNDEYFLNEDIITINFDGDMEVNLYNEKKKGSILITKYGQEYNYNNNTYISKPLENVNFNLYALEDIKTKDEVMHYEKETLITTKETNENGLAYFNDLILGSYYLKEDVKKEYVDNNDIYKFDLKIKEDNQIDIFNELKKKDLIIQKKDSISMQTIEGVVFEIFYNGQSIGLYTTNDIGEIILKDMPLGIYKIKEVATKDNYVLDDNIYELDLEKENTLLVLNNPKILIPNALSNKPLSKIFVDIATWFLIFICLRRLK